MRLPLISLTALALAGWPVLAAADSGRGTGDARPQPIRQDSLESLRWKARLVVVLGNGAQVEAQTAALQADRQALIDRDMVILIDGPGAGPLRDRAGNGFAILLIGKDGGIKRVWTEPVAAQEIFDLIDTMPMRRREAAQDG
ncbi:DUF4174 domain-containing protein [Paracoccus sediminis]|uniref:DUF4174 domain-containing protein n=1 Tax=Paracoccus sediminis TaxID=1214787 RepID=A0A238XQ58_9RHOB|nr:DUF4174 domain-containing protein [Paracoccus sediminis]TBN48194.1 DUF4174 domain-containing protein [Paracoccus sediminis]SNR60484.1 protein of unknown function [Paracoccus sediminis]